MSSQRVQAVVLNGSPTGLCAVRALGRRGIRTAVVRTKRSHMAGHSRWALRRHDLFDFQDNPESLLELLERNEARWRGAVLLPSCDRTLTLLARHRERLAPHFRVAAPPWEVVRRVLSKDETYRVAREVGIDLPIDYGPATPAIAARDDLVFPVIVKPVLSHAFSAQFGSKLFVAANRAELRDAVARLEGTGLEARIQDLIPGGDDHFHNYTVFLDERGDPIAEFGFRKLRKSPPFYGVARMAEPLDTSELRERTIELLRRIGWSGLASAEYKLDPRDGRHRLMEVNGRMYLAMGLAYRCGIDYPALAWSLAAGEPTAHAVASGWNGIWLDLRAELLYGLVLRDIEKLSWRETLAPYRRPKTYAVWSMSDPRPFVAELTHLAWEGLGMLRSRLAGETLRQRVGALDHVDGPHVPAPGPGHGQWGFCVLEPVDNGELLGEPNWERCQNIAANPSRLGIP